MSQSKKALDFGQAIAYEFGLQAPIILVIMEGTCTPSLSIEAAAWGSMEACDVLLMTTEQTTKWLVRCVKDQMVHSS